MVFSKQSQHFVTDSIAVGLQRIRNREMTAVAPMDFAKKTLEILDSRQRGLAALKGE